MQDHDLKNLLAEDFSKLVNTLSDPAFADAIMNKLKKAQRVRLWVVGGAGVIGAAIAGVQISTVANIAMAALPSFSTAALTDTNSMTMMVMAAVSAVVLSLAVLLPKNL